MERVEEIEKKVCVGVRAGICVFVRWRAHTCVYVYVSVSVLSRESRLLHENLANVSINQTDFTNYFAR